MASSVDAGWRLCDQSGTMPRPRALIVLLAIAVATLVPLAPRAAAPPRPAISRSGVLEARST